MAQNHLRRLDFRLWQNPRRQLPMTGEDTPSLDPAAIEHAYRRERARRRATRRAPASTRATRMPASGSCSPSSTLLTVVIGLTAFHEIQTNFGIFQ